VSTEDTFERSFDLALERKTDELAQVPPQIGRYMIIRILGEGGLGRVYLARDSALNREIAIKVRGRISRSSPEGRARFDREAMLMARLDHPNIVKIHDMGEEDGSFYVVLEYLDCGDLRRRLSDGAWPPDEAARLVATLARAMYYAHSRGILHRDLKPPNIVFDKNGTPKITDFGLAKLMGEQQEDAMATDPGMIMGTPSYMSPEQVRGEISGIGPAADIYALGVILYELLAGRRPFVGGTPTEMLSKVLAYQADPPSRWHPGLPRELDAICLKCLEKKPERRYSTAAALADDLERFVAGKAIIARPPGAWDRLRRLFSSKKSLAGQDPPGR
jgi:eukaryotic-like serine/threonine-protein kinase